MDQKMILQNGDNKPKVDRFENPEQRVIYKEYNALRVIDGILYRQTENKLGMNQEQLVLPRQKVIEVVNFLTVGTYDVERPKGLWLKDFIFRA